MGVWSDWRRARGRQRRAARWSAVVARMRDIVDLSRVFAAALIRTRSDRRGWDRLRDRRCR